VFYSGIGGQMDFIRGAQRSEGGKPIICLPSIADTLEGRVSRIVPHLTEGAGVVTTRADVHYVVTEYGVAYLHGKSIRERVLQLISIAHPDYRGDLLEFAKTRSWVYPDQKVPLGNAAVFPADLRKSLALKDGTEVVFRAIKPTDERRMQDLFYKLSEQSVYLRWFTVLRKMPHAKVQEYTNVDYRERMGIVGVIEPEKIIALAGYDLEPSTNLAECAFVVDDKYQNMGLGAFSLKFLAEVAQSNGIRGFKAYVLRENRAMLAVFQNSGYSLDMKLEEDMYVITLRFEIPKK
jgi:RimJ/RimL family protein N-acetyltransferase